MTEAYFQNKKVVPWLKAHGAYVVKTRPGMGTPVGCPDVLFFYREKWGAIECKASITSPFRAGQKETLWLLSRHNEFVWAAYPENWEEIKKYLEQNFFLNA